jgi:hypothetical protein
MNYYGYLHGQSQLSQFGGQIDNNNNKKNKNKNKN